MVHRSVRGSAGSTTTGPTARSWADGGAPPQRTFSELAAAAALHCLTTQDPYLPWGAGTMRVAGLVAVCNDVVLSARRCVLELADRTTVLHVPLASHPHGQAGLAWYDQDGMQAGLDAALDGAAVDLLLVDGPPADTADTVLARYPERPSSREAAR